MEKLEYNWFNKKRGWNRISALSFHSDLVQIFEEVVEEAKRVKVFPSNISSVAYYLNNQLSAIASCSWHYYQYDKKYDIGFCFNEQVTLQFSAEQLREIVIHEVAHACSIGHHHDTFWQYQCRKIGARWGYLYHNFARTEQNAAINACMKEQKRAKANYMVKCPACGRSWLYQRATRAVNHPESFTCCCGWKGLETVLL